MLVEQHSADVSYVNAGITCDVGAECVDQLPHWACDVYVELGYCKSDSANFLYVKEKCPKICG